MKPEKLIELLETHANQYSNAEHCSVIFTKRGYSIESLPGSMIGSSTIKLYPADIRDLVAEFRRLKAIAKFHKVK